MIAILILDALWLSIVLPALAGEWFALRQANADRAAVLGQRIDGGVRILINGALRRERVRLAFHVLMLLIGAIAFLSRSAPQPHRATVALIENAIVTFALIAGEALQTYNALADLRDRRRALSRVLQLPGSLRWRWLFRHFWE